MNLFKPRSYFSFRELSGGRCFLYCLVSGALTGLRLRAESMVSLLFDPDSVHIYNALRKAFGSPAVLSGFHLFCILLCARAALALYPDDSARRRCHAFCRISHNDSGPRAYFNSALHHLFPLPSAIKMAFPAFTNWAFNVCFPIYPGRIYT